MTLGTAVISIIYLLVVESALWAKGFLALATFFLTTFFTWPKH